MFLSKIIGDFPTKDKIKRDLEISGIEFDLDKVTEGCLYICLKEDFEEAKNCVNRSLRLGAVAVLTKFSEFCDCDAEIIIVKNLRKAFSIFSANFYSNPQNNLKIVGVVGTNGKTSTCKILESILNYAGVKTAYVGTLGVSFGDYKVEQELTTPDPNELFKTLRSLVDLGAQTVVMEYSAHAIFLEKLSAIKFEVLIFTNCTQDHLDFFKDFSIYEQVKTQPFLLGQGKKFIFNTDDALGLKMFLSFGGISYGIYSPSDVFAVNIKENENGVSFVINLFDNVSLVNLKLLGEFNVYNTLSAVICAKILGVSEKTIFKSLSSVETVSGRFEKVAIINGASVFIDYAHTPDGLEKSLISARKVTKKNLYCVFGCGGNRDKSKRAIMGRIAGDICDFVVVTTDNPRYEDSAKIINEIELGVRESTLDYICINSRKKAIIYALKNLEKGDTLLIAGKGSENYQDILGVKREFSDKQVVLEYLDNG